MYNKERISDLVSEFIKDTGLRGLKVAKVRDYLSTKLIGEKVPAKQYILQIIKE